MGNGKYDFNNSLASSGVSGVNNAADAQATNKKDFDNAINTLSGFFSGNVASKFMQQASQHAQNLANDTDSMRGTASELDGIRREAVKRINEISR